MSLSAQLRSFSPAHFFILFLLCAFLFHNHHHHHVVAAVVVSPPDHIVLVFFENANLSAVLAQKSSAFVSLLSSGVSFSNHSAITHPSQPNYIAFFSGSTQGVTNNNYPAPGSPFSTPNLASKLLDNGMTFLGYSEDLPSIGFTGQSSGGYVSKHNPWVAFSNVPANLSLPLTMFPSDFTQLPTFSFVVPNLCHSGHDCSLDVAQQWLNDTFSSYVSWAQTHNSLLVVTFDESAPSSPANTPIYLLMAGANVARNITVCDSFTHYSLQRWFLELFSLTPYNSNLQNANQMPTSLWFNGSGWDGYSCSSGVVSTSTSTSSTAATSTSTATVSTTKRTTTTTAAPTTTTKLATTTTKLASTTTKLTATTSKASSTTTTKVNTATSTQLGSTTATQASSTAAASSTVPQSSSTTQPPSTSSLSSSAAASTTIRSSTAPSSTAITSTRTVTTSASTTTGTTSTSAAACPAFSASVLVIASFLSFFAVFH